MYLWRLGKPVNVYRYGRWQHHLLIIPILNIMNISTKWKLEFFTSSKIEASISSWTAVNCLSVYKEHAIKLSPIIDILLIHYISILQEIELILEQRLLLLLEKGSQKNRWKDSIWE